MKAAKARREVERRIFDDLKVCGMEVIDEGIGGCKETAYLQYISFSIDIPGFLSGLYPCVPSACMDEASLHASS